MPFFQSSFVHFLKSSSILALAGFGLIAGVNASSADDPRLGSGSRTYTRSLTLADIGYPQGFRFDSMGGKKDLFFALPKNVNLRRAHLMLGYDLSAAFDGKRSLEVEFGSKTVFAKSLRSRGESNLVNLDLPVGAEHDEYLTVGVSLGRMVSENRCVDQRLAGEHMNLTPDTKIDLAFDLGLNPDVATVFAMMPHAINIWIPARALSEAEYSSALNLARTLQFAGRKVTFKQIGPDEINGMNRAFQSGQSWDTGSIIIASQDEANSFLSKSEAQATQSGARIVVTDLNGNPGIVISGVHPDLAGLFGIKGLMSAAGARGLNVEKLGEKKPSGEIHLLFDELHTRISPIDMIDRAVWDINVSSRDLPVNTSISGIRLDLNISPDTVKTGSVISAFFNEQLLASTAVEGTETGGRLQFDVPAGSVGIDNHLQVVVQRQPHGGDCMSLPQSYPVQLMGSSEILLKSADALDDFTTLAPLFRKGANIIVDHVIEDKQVAVLDLALKLAGNLVAPDVPVSVVFPESKDTSRPFISLSSLPPVAGDHAEIPVHFDAGHIMMKSARGDTLVDLSGMDNVGVAQIVRQKYASSDPPMPPEASPRTDAGLWVRSGNANDIPVPEKLKLDRGNVALFNANGVNFSTSTARDHLVEISYLDKYSVSNSITRYYSQIVGLLWLLGAIAFIYAIRSVLRAQKWTSRASNSPTNINGAPAPVPQTAVIPQAVTLPKVVAADQPSDKKSDEGGKPAPVKKDQ